jgi:hypothetical protein
MRVEVRSGGVDGTVVDRTDCVEVRVDSRARFRLELDLDPRQGLTLKVSGYDNSICLGEAGWMGLATDVAVSEGKVTLVPIYVTRRGLRLNDTRAAFSRPRVFASATPLPDGRVLLAGGFDVLEESNGEFVLEAACNAAIYDPGSATIEATVLLAAGCRGFHRALELKNGKVLLVGGASKATVRLQDNLVVVPSPNDILSSADLFDPRTMEFSPLGPFWVLTRADAAAVVLEDGAVVLMGGRTAAGKSRDIVVGRQAGEASWNWSVEATLAAERSGSHAATLQAGIFLAGGGDFGTEETVELLHESSFASLPVDPPVPAPNLSGHSLVQLGSSRIVLVGGIAAFPGATPTAQVLKVRFQGAIPEVSEYSLSHPRAHHVAMAFTDGRILVAGGLEADLSMAKDLEILPVDGDGELLQDLLGTGAAGMAAAPLPDGSILLAGGMDVTRDIPSLSSVIQLLSP